MRALALLLVMACSKPIPDAPDKAAFAASDDKCAAVAPRAARCAIDIQSADLDNQVDVLGKDMVAKLKDELRKAPSAAGEDEKIFAATCLGDTALADRIYACWRAPDCAALVACAFKK